VPLFAAILRIPFAIIGPLIVIVCFIGAYTVASAVPDLWFALIFGLVGYVFKKLDYPIAPLVLALVLGDKAEDAFRQSMLMSQGSLSIFVSNPLVTTITALAIVLLTWPLWAKLFGVARARFPQRELAE
jgi:TctA family transporter